MRDVISLILYKTELFLLFRRIFSKLPDTKTHEEALVEMSGEMMMTCLQGKIDTDDEQHETIGITESCSFAASRPEIEAVYNYLIAIK